MEKLHLTKKSESKKVADLQISAPIPGSFEHRQHMRYYSQDYGVSSSNGIWLDRTLTLLLVKKVEIQHPDPVILPRRYSDLAIFAEGLHRELFGTKIALASKNQSIKYCEIMLRLQDEREADVETNNTVLREEIVELKKQIVEEKRIADKLRRSGGKSRNALKTEVSLLTSDKTYLEGVVQEMLEDAVERDVRLESLALSMLETLGEARGVDQ